MDFLKKLWELIVKAVGFFDAFFEDLQDQIDIWFPGN